MRLVSQRSAVSYDREEPTFLSPARHRQVLSTNVILIFGSHVVGDLADKPFRSTREPPPYAASSRTPGRIRWNSDQTESSVQLFGIGFRAPPAGSLRFHL